VNQYWVEDIYGPVIQGEGPLLGRPTIFVRMAGCDNRCEWCDTSYAVLPQYKSQWKRMTAEEIVEAVRVLDPPSDQWMVTFSGGNPLLQDLDEVLSLLIAEGRFRIIAVETQGTKYRPCVDKVYYLVISPKPPSSGCMTDLDSEDLKRCAEHFNSFFKIVVFDEEDWEYAMEVRQRFWLSHCDRFYLQAGTMMEAQSLSGVREAIYERLIWLQDKVLSWGDPDIIVLPQMHTLLHGQKRGI